MMTLLLVRRNGISRRERLFYQDRRWAEEEEISNCKEGAREANDGVVPKDLLSQLWLLPVCVSLS